DSRDWPDADRTLLLQCVFTGKAQEAYSALSSEDCKVYEKVKSAVLKAYELVPEAYRQRFRSWRKTGKQTHVEFARDLVSHFNRWCSSSDVKTFDRLCDLVILEQFKQSVPSYIATYINEHKVTCPSEAAVLADEYVLTHRRIFGERYNGDKSQKAEVVFPKVDQQQSTGKSDPSLCNYCHQKGHWKKECTLLKERNKPSQVKSAGLAAPIHTLTTGDASELVVPFEMQVKPTDISDIDSGYAPFMSDGFVTLIGSDMKVPVRILRDSGALHSFVREAILPFSPSTDTGSCVPVRGMGLQTLFVPVHKLFLSCDLVQGVAEVGVRPELPVEGVDIILGNDLAGGRVWPDNVRPDGGKIPDVSLKNACASFLEPPEVTEPEPAVLAVSS
uniref:SCAN box domain-containing protein n=1 Tax=Myripristis murdjan TaxID=586833 RepID=A0A667WFT4_9TELE